MSAAPPKLPMKKLPAKGPPLAGKAPPGGKVPLAKLPSKTPTKVGGPALSKGAPGAGGSKVPPPKLAAPAPKQPAKILSSALSKKMPMLPGQKAPVAGMKAPVLGAGGKSTPLTSKAPVKLPLKLAAAPTGTTAEKGPAKLPLKVPLKIPLKLPLKLPPKAPPSAPKEKEEDEESGDGDDDENEKEEKEEGEEEGGGDGADTARTNDTMVQGGREENLPTETPRDMPSGGDKTPMVDTPRDEGATPRTEGGGSVPPPPTDTPPQTPRDEKEGGNALTPKPPELGGTPSPAPAAAKKEGSSGSDTDKDSPPPATKGDTAPPTPAAGSPLATQQQQQMQGQGQMSPSGGGVGDDAVGGSWVTHSLSPTAALVTPPQAVIDQYEAKIQRLERKIIDGETLANNLSGECARLRETLFEREGATVVQHIAELERENKRLRLSLQKEKDTVLYHQSKHMETMDELVALRHSINTTGDYEKLQETNTQLNTHISELIRANTELSLRISDLNEAFAMSNVHVDPMMSAASPQRALTLASQQMAAQDNSGLPTYVRVRRTALCAHCKEMVERWENLVIQRAQQQQQQQLLASSSMTPASVTKGMMWRSGAASDSTSSPLRYMTPSTPMRGTGTNGWCMLRVPDGRVVYHNTITNRSQWDRPDDFPVQ